MQLLYKCHEDNSVRMIGANNSVFDEEKDLKDIAKKSFFPFQDMMIPTDFHDTDKGCCIVSFICSINRFVQLDSDGDDLLDLYTSLLDNCGLFYTQVYPDEEGNDVLYADVHKLSQIFRSKNCREFMRSSFGVDTL